jgi:hypothetical protein
MTIPKKKKDQLSLAQYGGITFPANRPDPDDPGGLGAEESETERTGPTQGVVVAIHEGGHWAEVGQYYDSANDPVTAWFWPERGRDDPSQAESGALALLRPRAVGAIMSLAARSRKGEAGFRNKIVPEMTGGAP